MHYLQITNINNLLSFQDPLVMQKKNYRLHITLEKDKKVSAITIRQYTIAVMHFYSMNYVTLDKR